MISFIEPPKPNLPRFNQYLNNSIERNHYTNFGINHNTLEQRFKELTGIENIVITTNATVALDGLHNILATKCGLAYLPSFTFPATNQGCQVSTIMSRTVSGGNDVGRPIWDNMYYGDIYTVTVNPFGSINEPCTRPRTTYWLVDNAAGLLSQAKDWLDAGADAIIYSLHATKILSACEGGVVFFKNKKLYDEYKEYINFGYSILEDGTRVVGERGSNHKMSELNAAWCLMNLDTLNDEIKKRSEIMQKYIEFCENFKIPYIPSLQAFWICGKKSSYVFQKYAAENEVDIKPYYLPLPITNNSCAVTDIFSKNGVCLPIRSTLKDYELEHILKMLGEAKGRDLI